ncbi:patatin-like phospholipase family protein [uncultured Cohaesibacter sp.]|uniref:patatin-like phospholipase family protein n=1 Tax=uncultured Cohaesibacter sp. TaxID=1002546 RepID=UPI00292E44C4|nr:patatin-like phospholipase family protein [uncultured Cohaesibacter sp.]
MSDKKVAIAFGGGGARGLSHIWIMEALDELGVRPSALSGTSIGALAAVCYGSGIRGADLRDYLLETFSNTGEVLSRFWKHRPRSFSDLLSVQNPRASWAQFDPEWVVETFLPPEVKRDFAELEIYTSLSTTDYFGGREVIRDEGDILPAVAASIAIPALFRPVEIDGLLLVDGGCVNPMPVDHVRSRADIVIGVDVVGVPLKPAEGKLGGFEMGFGATQILMQTIQLEKMRHDKVDLLVQPYVNDFKPLEFLKASDILEASKDTKEQVKQSLGALLEC